MAEPIDGKKLGLTFVTIAKAACTKITAAQLIEHRMGSTQEKVTLTAVEALSLCAVAGEALGIRGDLAAMTEDDAIRVLREFQNADDRRELLRVLQE